MISLVGGEKDSLGGLPATECFSHGQSLDVTSIDALLKPLPLAAAGVRDATTEGNKIQHFVINSKYQINIIVVNRLIRTESRNVALKGSQEVVIEIQ